MRLPDRLEGFTPMTALEKIIALAIVALENARQAYRARLLRINEEN